MGSSCPAWNAREGGVGPITSTLAPAASPALSPVGVRLLCGCGGDSHGPRGRPGGQCSCGWWAWPAWRRGQVAQPVLPLMPHSSHPSACNESFPPPQPRSHPGTLGPRHAVISEQGLPRPLRTSPGESSLHKAAGHLQGPWGAQSMALRGPLGHVCPWPIGLGRRAGRSVGPSEESKAVRSWL